MRWRSVLWAFCLLCASGPTGAALPRAEARLDTHQTTLGKPVHLSLVLRYSDAQKPAVPPAEQLFGSFTARQLGQAIRRQLEGAHEMELRYVLRVYELGQQRLPPLSITFVDAGGDTLVRSTAPLHFEVLSVRDEGESELRDISPPVDIAGGIPLWLAAVLGVLAVLAIVVVILWLLDRRQKAEVVEQVPPADYAAEFDRIAALGLLERGEFKLYYSLLSDNLRRYMEEHLGIEAMEQTTAEIRLALSVSEIGQAAAAEVEAFLQAADLVKFARFTSPLEEARRVPKMGADIVHCYQALIEEVRRREEQLAAPTKA